jgi:hypothetical protein
MDVNLALAPYPISSASLGNLEIMLKGAACDVFAVILRAYLDHVSVLRLARTSRSIQLCLHVLHRGIMDRLAHLAILVPRLYRHGIPCSYPAVLPMEPQFLGRMQDAHTRKLATTYFNSIVVHSIGEAIVEVPEYPTTLLFVVAARLQPSTEFMPGALGTHNDINLFSTDLRDMEVLGALECVSKARRYWNFVHAPFDTIQRAFRASPLWLTPEREFLEERAAAIASIGFTKHHRVSINLIGTPLEAILTEQRRHLVDYVMALRRIRRDMNLEQHLQDSGDLAIEGVFVIMKRIAAKFEASPLHNVAPLFVTYIAPVQRHVVHSVA